MEADYMLWLSEIAAGEIREWQDSSLPVPLRHAVSTSVSLDSKNRCEQYGFRIGIAGKDMISIYFVDTAQR